MSRTLNTLFDESCARFPGRAALATASETWTFSRLRDEVLRSAAAFRARGVRKGRCVALALRNGPEYVATYLGLCRLGAVAVPINFLIKKPEELRYMLRDCAAVGVVTQREFLPGFIEAKDALSEPRLLWATDAEDAARGVERLARVVETTDRGAAARPDPESVSDLDPAAILYTSGTTGKPKGVMLSHGNLVSNSESAVRAIGLDERGVILCILPMFHTFSWTACVLIPLALGGKVVICPSITPAKPWLSLMARHGVTVFAAVPQIYSVLAKEASGIKGLVLKYWFFRKVRFCVSGAAPLSLETARAFRSSFGLDILEGYGLTETSPVVTLNPPQRPVPGSVGVPIPGVRVKVVDEQERELPAGAEGEVCVLGPNVMLGYHQRPEDTRDAFTRDGWFKTGDIGVLDADGYLYIRDRKKDMIIVKGLKVFSAQVEAALLSHPLVDEAAVVGIPDADGDETIKAFVTIKPGAAPDKAALLRFCREKLDAYKRPRDIEIVETLPKNALQKVLKRVLRQQELDKRLNKACPRPGGVPDPGPARK